MKTKVFITPANIASWCRTRKCRLEFRTEYRDGTTVTLVRATTRHAQPRFRGKRVAFENADHDANRALGSTIDEMNRALRMEPDAVGHRFEDGRTHQPSRMEKSWGNHDPRPRRRDTARSIGDVHEDEELMEATRPRAEGPDA